MNKTSDPWSYASIPAPSLNGGWYTGDPFPADAPWRNFPTIPDVSFMTHQNLPADAPPGAAYQYASSFRPGNNAPSMPGTMPYGESNSMLCTQQPATSLPGKRARFAKYAYTDAYTSG